MEVWFYHLQRQPLDQVLPILAGKALERGWRVAVQTVDDLRLKRLDELLWTFKAESFLPHGIAGDARAARQPLVLTTTSDNPNGAVVRMFVEGAELAFDPTGPAYERMIFLFDGRNEIEVEAARAQWTRLKGADLTLTYWQQDEAGRWKQRIQARPQATTAPAKD